MDGNVKKYTYMLIKNKYLFLFLYIKIPLYSQFTYFLDYRLSKK